MSAFLDYCALDGVNWSRLKHLRRSPLHYRHVLDQGSEDTTSRLTGRALHTAVMEPHDFDERYPVFDGDRRGPAWKEFQAAHPGAEILRRVEADAVQAQAAAVRAHPAAGPMLESATHREHALRWTDPVTGIECKGLLDLVGDGWIADLKGTGDLALFERLAIRDGYHLQLAWYRWGWSVAHGCPPPRALLLPVEVKSPHDVAVYELSPTLLDIATREIRGLLDMLHRCRTLDVWPGRYELPEVMEAPAWMIPDLEIPDEGLELPDDLEL